MSDTTTPSKYRSGFTAKVLAGLTLVAAIGLSVLQPLAPAAAIGPIDLDANGEIVITKLMQPATPGEKPTGLPLDAAALSQLTPIAGVEFEARLIPGLRMDTNAGQEEISSLTVASAQARVAGMGATASGVTDAAGVLRFGGDTGELPVGVYLIEETAAPAGVIASDPFFVTIPMQHVTTHEWMYSVHVYPKNSNVSVGIKVFDQFAVTCTDRVTWTTENAIPLKTTINSYVSENLFAEQLVLADMNDVQVLFKGEGISSLVRDTDYRLESFTQGNHEGLRVTFLEPGLLRLAAAINDDDPQNDTVLVEYQTTATGPGEFHNTVNLYVDDALPVTAETMTKFGPLKILVHERDNRSNLIPGAQVRIFLNTDDAFERIRPITVANITDWQTDNNGSIIANCLRYSAFVNGLDRNTSDPLFRSYYGSPISYPAGWQGEWQPLSGTVNSHLAENAPTLDFRVWMNKPDLPEEPVTPIPGLPVTGGQLAGFSLGAIALVGIGALLMLRRRNNTEKSDPAV